MKILWLDDDIESIEYEMTVSLPEKFKDIEIKDFKKIADFIDYLSEDGKDIKDFIFIIDLMLIGESRYISFDGEEKIIHNELVAGIELYQNSLQNFSNNIIFYTSRGADKKVFKLIFDDKKYGVSIFFIEKDKKDTLFVTKLQDIINFIKEHNR